MLPTGCGMSFKHKNQIARWHHEIPRPSTANHDLRSRSTKNERQSSAQEDLRALHPHGVRAPRSTIQGLDLPHIETLTEKTHETILYPNKRDPRSTVHVPRLAGPTGLCRFVSVCVGLCQVCVGFKNLLFPLLSYTYTVLCQLCR